MANIEYSDDGTVLLKAHDVEGHFVISDSVTEIGTAAFYGCTGLTSVKIPDSVTEIGSDAFSRCTGLTSIEIPDSVTEIGIGAFNECTGILEPIYHHHCLVHVPTTYIGRYVIPEGVTKIAGEAFFYCKGLTSIKIPDSVTEMDCFVFYGCTSLTSIEIPNSLQVISDLIFDGSDLNEVHMQSGNPNAIEIIDDWSSFNDEYVDRVIIPITLYVPAGSEEAYRKHPFFSWFKDVIAENAKE